MRKYHCLLTFLLLSFVAFAQNHRVTGQIRDSLTRQPLPYASVTFTAIKDSHLVKAVVSDNKGVFYLKQLPGGWYRLQVDYTGYGSYTNDSISVAGGTVSLDAVYLSLQNRQLKGVVVTAARPFIVQSADKLTLHVAESPVAAGSTAYDVIARAPGVIADNNGNLQVRGRSVAVYLDGRRSNLGQEELKNLLGSMASSSIDKVEIMVNPSAKYDAQGGAVINIVTVRSKNLGTNGLLTAGSGAGRFGRFNTGLSLNHRTKKTNIYGSWDNIFNRQYYHNRSIRYLSPALSISEAEYDVRTRNNHSYKAGIDYDVNKSTSMGILFRGFTNFRNRMVSNRSVLDHATGADSSSWVATTGYARFVNPSVNAYFKTALDSAGKKEITLNADYLLFHKTWNNLFTTQFFNEKLNEYRPAHYLRDFSPARNKVGSLAVDYVQPVKKARLEAGLKSTFAQTNNNVLWETQVNQAWTTDTEKTNHFVYRENIHAGYVTIARSIKKYNLTAGLRAEQTHTQGRSVTLGTITERSYFNLFPNLSVLYQKSPKQQFSFAYRKNIVRYGFDFVNPFIVYQSQYAYSQGNPYLRPQINHSVELSHVYNYRVFTSLGYTRSVKALAPVYRQELSRNLLVSSYDNLASANMIVMTVTLNRTIRKKWTTVNTIGGFYVAYDLTDQTHRPANATLTAYLSSNNTLVLPRKYTLELTGMYRSPFASGIYKMNSFFNVSTGIGKPVAKGKGNLKLNVTDIFDTQQFENRVSDYQGVNGLFTNKIESRFVNLVFTWKFGNSNVRAIKARKSITDEERARLGAH